MTNMQKAENFLMQAELLLTADEFHMLLTKKLAK